MLFFESGTLYLSGDGLVQPFLISSPIYCKPDSTTLEGLMLSPPVYVAHRIGKKKIIRQ